MVFIKNKNKNSVHLNSTGRTNDFQKSIQTDRQTDKMA